MGKLINSFALFSKVRASTRALLLLLFVVVSAGNTAMGDLLEELPTDPWAINGFVAALKDPDAAVRKRAASEVGVVGESMGITGLGLTPRIMELLKHPNEGVRHAAACGLKEVSLYA